MTAAGDTEARRDQQAVRERVWAQMSEAKVVGFPGAEGRIPNFTGAGRAAELLATLPAWAGAATMKANPDMPQLAVRARALADGKVVYMAVPKLTDTRPFRLLDPAQIAESPRTAASITGSARLGAPVALEELEHIDLIVCGTVAVNRAGVRIGKGGGFSDLEFALGVEQGVIDDDTVVVTTVHGIQVLDADLPETDHDFRVDIVVTPDEVIECPRVVRPPGILWDHLDVEKVAAVPAIAARAGGRATSRTRPAGRR